MREARCCAYHRRADAESERNDGLITLALKLEVAEFQGSSDLTMAVGYWVEHDRDIASLVLPIEIKARRRNSLANNHPAARDTTLRNKLGDNPLMSAPS